MESITGEWAELNGSEKQVDWADEIRLQKVCEVKTALSGLPKDHPKYDEAMKRLQNLYKIDSAKTWIDNRNRKGFSILGIV